MTPDPVLELLCSLDPTGPTLVHELCEVIGVRFQVDVMQIYHAAKRQGWNLHCPDRPQIGTGGRAITFRGNKADLQYESQPYWRGTHAGEDAGRKTLADQYRQERNLI